MTHFIEVWETRSGTVVYSKPEELTWLISALYGTMRANCKTLFILKLKYK